MYNPNTDFKYTATIDNAHQRGMLDIMNKLDRKGIRIPDEVMDYLRLHSEGRASLVESQSSTKTFGQFLKESSKK